MTHLIRNILSLIFLVNFFCASAQFEGPAGTIGSSAMHKDSSDFIDWAVGCTLQRGYKDLSDQALGLVTFGTPIAATGFSDAQTVSLGDGGIATITFTAPIINGPGNDFAIFENSFSANFLELAFVEVSSDGVNYFRFQATSNTPTNIQIGPFDETGDATLINNLAGKYIANFGTPFDLEELTGIPGLDLQNITHVKIIDIVGSISSSFGSQDQFGTYINDPFPTPFESGGFDLDAVGVIHQQPLSAPLINNQLNISIFPNPAKHGQTITIQTNSEFDHGALYSINGAHIISWTETSYALPVLSRGVYLVRITSTSSAITKQIIID